MIFWQKSSDYSIRSDCGKYSIAKFIVSGKSLYRAFQHEGKEVTGLSIFDSPQAAKDYVLTIQEAEAVNG